MTGRIADQSAKRKTIATDDFSGRTTDILSFVAKRRLPDVSQARSVPEAGGLMSYAPDVADQFRRAATYVDMSKHVGRVNGESIVVDEIAP